MKGAVLKDIINEGKSPNRNIVIMCGKKTEDVSNVARYIVSNDEQYLL